MACQVKQLINAILPRKPFRTASKFAEGLSELQPHNCKGVATLLRYLYGLSADIFITILKEVDPEKARKNWSWCLQKTSESKIVIAWICAVSQPVEGPISGVINQLKAKYPTTVALVERKPELSPPRKRYKQAGS